MLLKNKIIISGVYGLTFFRMEVPQAGIGSPVKINGSSSTWMQVWTDGKGNINLQKMQTNLVGGTNLGVIWWGKNQNRKLVSYKTISAKDLKERSWATALFCFVVFFWSLLGFFFGAGGGFGGFFFTLFWLLYFMAWLNTLSPKITDQDKRNLDCSRHPFPKGSRTQLLPGC